MYIVFIYCNVLNPVSSATTNRLYTCSYLKTPTTSTFPIYVPGDKLLKYFFGSLMSMVGAPPRNSSWKFAPKTAILVDSQGTKWKLWYPISDHLRFAGVWLFYQIWTGDNWPKRFLVLLGIYSIQECFLLPIGTGISQHILKYTS